MTQIDRQHLLTIYQVAIEGVNGRRAVKRYFASHNFADDAPCYLIAIGKAAASMVQGAFDQLGRRIERALVITRYDYGSELNMGDYPLELIEAGHPQPDENSLIAGQRLLTLLDKAPTNARFIFLISGGTSALVEQLPPTIDLTELQRVNRWLLGSGLAIDEFNQVRRALSLIKGGRLIPYLKGRAALNLLMSDVPGDDPAVVGSGLLVVQQNSCSQAVIDKMPAWLRHHLEVTTIDMGGVSAQIDTVVIAAPKDARRAAAVAAKALGYPVHCHDDFIAGDVMTAAQQLVNELNHCEPGIHIWSSETTVQLPNAAGQGGRCQQLALAVAQAMSVDRQLVLLAAGSDGSDGGINQHEADAGAMVDNGTIQRGQLAGFDAAIALEQANAGEFLEASGDLISTGPTGANVMDLIIAYVPGCR